MIHIQGDCMKKTEEITEFSLSDIEKCFLFDAMPRDELEGLLKNETVKIISCDDGEIMLDSENFANALFLVLKGSAAVWKKNERGREVFLRFISKGELFGAATLFGREEKNSFCTSVRAKKKCTALMIPAACVTELLLAHPETAIEYIRFLSEKIRFLNSKIDSYTTDGATDRLLKYLKQRKNEDANGESLKNINMSRLAKQLNIGRASLYRSLDELEKNRMIVRKNNTIYIVGEENEKIN